MAEKRSGTSTDLDGGDMLEGAVFRRKDTCSRVDEEGELWAAAGGVKQDCC